MSQDPNSAAPIGESAGVASMPSSNNIIESYVMSSARYEGNVYVERLIFRLLEKAQKYTHGIDFRGESPGKIEVGEWGDAEVILPVRAILSDEDDKNYDKAKRAINEMMGKYITFEDENTYRTAHLLNDVELKKLRGRMVLRVNRYLWSAMLDYSKGYRMIDIETVMRLRGRYAMRLYSLVCRSTKPLSFTIGQLREMWDLKDKYPKTKDFVKNTIQKAKEELDEKSQYSFSYQLVCSKSDPANAGRTSGRLKVTSITFYPEREYLNATRKELKKDIAPSLILGSAVTSLLKTKFEFVNQGISNNMNIFEPAYKHLGEDGLLDFLYQIAPTALRAQNPQGYVVGALRKHLINDVNIPEDEL